VRGVRDDSKQIKQGRRKMAAKSREETPKTVPTFRGGGWDEGRDRLLRARFNVLHGQGKRWYGIGTICSFLRKQRAPPKRNSGCRPQHQTPSSRLVIGTAECGKHNGDDSIGATGAIRCLDQRGSQHESS
jgi:hypothetical protein